ncbi:hypothetical protein FL857_07125 [Criibacterium bergeronii]|uniref:Uncharacterized protein n=2 Tax=Criibacterium bergeronii TaxID=1871336 RepID=A0A552V556_9FIRM|nr:hypothetical protein FL857_07125 [Criibacterium bergeronii]
MNRLHIVISYTIQKMKKKSNNTVIPSYCHAFNDGGGNNNKYYYYLPYTIESEAETLKQRGIKLYIIAFGIEEPSSEYMKSFASKDENGNPLFYNLNPIIKVEKWLEVLN